MDSGLTFEIIGYVASGLILLSITQKSILRLRIFGLIGGLTFLVYSIAIEAYPIAIVNVIASGIHLFYLRKLLTRKDEIFRVLHVLPDSRYLLDFIEFYREEIQGTFQPEFEYRPDPAQTTAFILRDMVPAGLFIGQAAADGTFEVKLDFVIPQYRDLRVGRYVYSEGSDLLHGGRPTCAWAVASNPEYARYLRRMGFTKRADEAGVYEIRLAA